MSLRVQPCQTDHQSIICKIKVVFDQSLLDVYGARVLAVSELSSSFDQEYISTSSSPIPRNLFVSNFAMPLDISLFVIVSMVYSVCLDCSVYCWIFFRKIRGPQRRDAAFAEGSRLRLQSASGTGTSTAASSSTTASTALSAPLLFSENVLRSFHPLDPGSLRLRPPSSVRLRTPARLHPVLQHQSQPPRRRRHLLPRSRRPRSPSRGELRGVHG